MDMGEESEFSYYNISQELLIDNTTNISTTTQRSTLEKTVSIVIPSIFACIIVLGFIGNVLVILVVCLNKQMKNSTNILILNLAIADLSFILICIPFTAYKYSNPLWVFGDTWCRISSYMTYVCAWASVYTLVLMCVDRLFAVVFAVRFPNFRSKSRVTVMVVIMWVVVLLANIPAFLFHGEKVYAQGTRKTCLLKVDTRSKQAFQSCFFTFGFMLPVVAISIMYGALLVSLRKRKSPTGKDHHLKTKRRVTILVITVVIAFIICWLPIQIILLFDAFEAYHGKDVKVGLLYVQFAANSLAYMNSCLNPILYALASTVFRKAFVDMLSCQTCRDKNVVSRTTETTQVRTDRNPTEAPAALPMQSLANNRAQVEHQQPLLSINNLT